MEEKKENTGAGMNLNECIKERKEGCTIKQSYYAKEGLTDFAVCDILGHLKLYGIPVYSRPGYPYELNVSVYHYFGSTVILKDGYGYVPPDSLAMTLIVSSDNAIKTSNVFNQLENMITKKNKEEIEAFWRE